MASPGPVAGEFTGNSLPADIPDFVPALADFGDIPALIIGSTLVTYADLARRAKAFASALGAGRRLIAIEAALSSHAIAAYLGALLGGHAVILEPADDAPARQAIEERFRPDLSYRRIAGRWRLAESTAGSSEPLHPALALVLLTSGSTGQGKGVRLAGSALAANAHAIARYLELGAGDRGVLHLPLHYSYGLSVLNSHLAVGASLHLAPDSILSPGFLAGVREQRCTSFPGVPHSYDLLESIGFRDQSFPDLRFMSVAGGRMADDMVRRYHDHLAARGKRLFVMYGQTEATARIAYVPPALLGRNLDRIGVAIPGGELGLVDDEGHAVEAVETVGELVYRGPNVMMGYAAGRADLGRGPEIETLRTGDLAVRDAAGLYRVVGRRRRMSKIAGVRLGHDALEAALARAGIAAAVVGDDRRLVAFHASPHAASEVRRRLAAVSGLTGRHVEARPVAELPRLPSGKVDYRALRAMLDEHPPVDDGGVLGDFRQTFFPQPVRASDSFVALGGDSLRYLELSLDLERRLGSLPPRWEQRPVRELSALRPGDLPAGLVSTDIVIRVLAILMILAHHATGSPLPAGSTALVVLVGFAMARFQRRALVEQDHARFFRPLVGVLALYYLLVAGYAVAWGRIPWASLLLVGNLGLTTPESRLMLPYSSWFVEVFVQIFLIVGGLFLLPGVRRLAAEVPFRLGLALLAGALALRLAGPSLWPIDGPLIFTVWWVLPLAAFGWSAAFADTPARRLLLAGAALLVLPLLAYVGGNWLGAWIRYGLQIPVILCLLYLPAVQLPAVLARACLAVAAATYHIYLFGGFAPDLLDGLIGLPRSRTLHAVLAVASGVALGLALFWVQRACGRLLAARLPRVWQGWRGHRQMSRV
ncbi:MAG: AMP-binding protein [Geminicoccaceae bacterium]